MRAHNTLLAGLLLAGTICARAANDPTPAGDRSRHHGAAPPEADGWTAYPLVVPVMEPRGDRAAAGLVVRHLGTATLEVVPPLSGAAVVSFPVNGDRARVSAAPDAGNYNWVTARNETWAQVTVASTVYFFANPGPAPTALLQRTKSELEIIPRPLPREHGSYRESETWRFAVRFRGRPLPNARVAFASEHGSKTSYATDEGGLIAVTFPNDVPESSDAGGQGHHMGPPRAKFVLAAEHDDAGRHYLTAFNYIYGPGADRGRSYWAGIGFGVLGMLLATPLLRRRKNVCAATR